MSCNECYYLFIDFFKQFYKDFEEYRYYYNYTPEWPDNIKRNSPTEEWINMENIDIQTRSNFFIEHQPDLQDIDIQTRSNFFIEHQPDLQDIETDSSYDDWTPITSDMVIS